MINREMDLVQHSLRNFESIRSKVDLKIVIINITWFVLLLISGLFSALQAGFFTTILVTFVSRR